MAIPLPDVSQFGDFTKGLSTGGNLFQQMMHPVMQQRQMQQADVHHKNNLGFKLQQLEQQGLHHKQNLGVTLEQLKMAQDLHPSQVANLKAQAEYHQAQADDLAFTQNLLNQLMGNGGGAPQMPMMGQRGDMQPPGPNVAPPSMQTIQQGFGGAPTSNPMSEMNPAVAGLIKKKTGIDPYAESPSMKSNREFQQFKDKEQYKLQQKSDLTKPTQSTVTENQKIVNAANSVLPILEKLRDGESYGPLSFPSGGKSKYKTRAGMSTDKMMTALKLPNQKESLNLVHQMTHRDVNESPAEFKERVQMVIDEIIENSTLANEVLTSSKVKQGNAGEVKRKRYNPKTGMVE